MHLQCVCSPYSLSYLGARKASLWSAAQRGAAEERAEEERPTQFQDQSHGEQAAGGEHTGPQWRDQESAGDEEARGHWAKGWYGAAWEVHLRILFPPQRREREILQQLEKKEESTLEIKETFTSLREEVDVKTKKLNKVYMNV